MKNISGILVFLNLVFGLTAQNKDSVKIYKNEIGVNTLPLVNIFSGATPMQSAKYSLNYRRFLSEKNVFRVAVSLYPFKDMMSRQVNGNIHMVEMIDTNYIYLNRQYRQTPKVQLNIGYERVFVSKRLTQSFGGELYFNYQHRRIEDRYLWSGKSTPFLAIDQQPNFNTNAIDSLGSVRVTDFRGVGLHLFYNLRLPVSKHWLVSATFGPSLTFSYNRDKVHDKTTDITTESFYSNIDFDGTFFSDLSICYRF